MSAPALFSIPPDHSFVDALARGLLAEAGDGDPLARARVLVLLPTRRACRALREAFLRHSEGKALLLPQLRPLGDIDEDELAFGAGENLDAGGIDLPPAISELRRRLLLAKRLMADPARGLSAEHAAWLAVELGRFLDRIQTERVGFDRLDGLAPEQYAEHWQAVVGFLRVLVHDWPAILAREGAIDSAERRNCVLAAQAEAWRARPPVTRIVAAGSTGSVPATAELLAVVAGLPNGAVVLPGLDRQLDDRAWELVLADESHPQHGLARLLKRMEVTRDSVADWPASDGAALDRDILRSRRDRVRLLSAALAPAEACDGWRALDPTAFIEPMRGVARIDAGNPREEAGAIALAMREALEIPGRTAALVTPDRDLARRVAAELKRWDIAIDDSAGVPLAATPPGTFLRLTARMAAERLAPVPLLAALKHPLAAGGLAAPAFRRLVRGLEVAALRGARPGAGFKALKAATFAERPYGPKLRVSAKEIAAWLDDLAQGIKPLTRVMARKGRVALTDLLAAHVAAAEALAATDGEEGPARLWAGDAGEGAALLVSELMQAADGFPTVAPEAYPALLDALMAGRVVRPRVGAHPRLHIWGLLEARLQRADLMILGGLNEGTWPPEAEADPWMSRPMRTACGLPLPERRLGLTAHDFAQAMGAAEILLTRAERVEGAPTVPSRWLLRIEAVLHALERTVPEGLHARKVWPGESYAAWHRHLHEAEAFTPAGRPAPRPPLAARPRSLSVTQVETLMRDPYALYARKVLDLNALDPIDADPGAAERGNFVHDALERFVRDCPDALPPDAVERLIAHGRDAFGEALAHPGVWAFWWPRFLRVAEWFVAQERARRAVLAASNAELKGAHEIKGPAGPFTVTAKADRIDRIAEGGLAILDYKTGAPPSDKQVDAGFAPQLPLEAAIAEAGGFEGLPAEPVTELAYWRLSGGRVPGVIKALPDPAVLAREALDGLIRTVAAFDREDTPYYARPWPDMAPRYSDYGHLERIAEWATLASDAE